VSNHWLLQKDNVQWGWFHSYLSDTHINKKKRKWGHTEQIREMKNECKILFEKLEGKTQIASLRCIWKDNIQIDTVNL
jgi:hypothetical protein